MPTSTLPVQKRNSQSKNTNRLAELEGKWDAIDRSQAIIEFELDGSILTANENFLQTMHYSLDEIVGQHHSMFVDREDASGPEYRELWRKLNRGEAVTGEFRRMAKGQKEVWIQASYTTILDKAGTPIKVVKFASDITKAKAEHADFSGKLAAISKSQAVIEFDLDGTVLTANENFLDTLGYRLNEVQGQHHSNFVDEQTRQSAEYKEFWEQLRRGEFVAGEFLRIGKGGREIWIQASYNPILDANGRPQKVVKYASDITAQVH